MLRSRLPEIAVEIRLVVEDAIEAGAETVAEEAKARVPVNTGRLRDAIHTDREPGGVYVVAGDDEAWYGHLVEHGTVRTPPRPFLVPSLDDQRDGIVEHVRSRLKGVQ